MSTTTEQPRPKPPERIGRCRKYPFCAAECTAFEKDFTRKGEWPYCTCGHTQGVHDIAEQETPK